jgi:hypothetical protein
MLIIQLWRKDEDDHVDDLLDRIFDNSDRNKPSK